MCRWRFSARSPPPSPWTGWHGALSRTWAARAGWRLPVRVCGADGIGWRRRGCKNMWVMTTSDWPVLVNLSRAAHIGYQQIAKFDPRTRIVASAWEEEYTLAECADGDQAKALIGLISQALANGTNLLDLRDIDLEQLTVDVATAQR